MTAGELIRFLESYDGNEDVEVHVLFDEVDAYGGAEAVTDVVMAGSREETEAGRPNRWPTITVAAGFGMCSEPELRHLVEYFADLARRLAGHGAP